MIVKFYLSTQDAMQADLSTHDQTQSPDDGADRWTIVLRALEQRELLTPFLLFSAGYAALPLIIKPILLLLTPVIEVLGFSRDGREKSA